MKSLSYSKVAILGCILFIHLCTYTSLLGQVAIVGTEADSNNLTKYLIDSKNGISGKFPFQLSNKQVYVYKTITGIHKVKWEGHDSLLLIVIKVKSKNNDEKRMVYQFTISPALPDMDQSQKGLNLADLIDSRKVTQYEISEFVTIDGKKRKRTIYLSTNSNL